MITRILIFLALLAPAAFADAEPNADIKALRDTVQSLEQTVKALQAQTPQATPQATPQVASVVKPDVKDAALAFLLDKAQKYSGKMEDVLGKAYDETVKETPGLLKEYCRWKAWENALYFFGPLAVFLVSFGCVWWGYFQLDWNGELSFPHAVTIGTVIISIISLGFTLGHIDNFFTLIQINVAPRVFVIEQVVALLKH